MTKRKRGYSRWSEEEEDALRLGVSKYGEGKWKRILMDDKLGKVFVHRSNVDLKDKWRTMLYADKSRPAVQQDASQPACSRDSSYTQRAPSPPSQDAACHATSRPPPSEPERVAESPEGQRAVEEPSGLGRIHGVSSKVDKALWVALEASKRRHAQMASSEQSLAERQLDLLREVWKKVVAHKDVTLLGRASLSELRGQLELGSATGSPSRHPAQFFRIVLAALREAAAGCTTEAATSRLAEFGSFVRRQFEVLCLADEACCGSLLPVLLGAENLRPKPPPPAAPLKARPACVSARRASKLQRPLARSRLLPELPKDLRELMAVDALTMIGSSRAKSPQKDAVREACNRKDAASTGLAISRTQSPTVSVPEGCGLDSTCVSAAMDKASELLSQSSSQNLLPVRELGLQCESSIDARETSAQSKDFKDILHKTLRNAESDRLFTLVPVKAPPDGMLAKSISPFSVLKPLVPQTELLPGAETWYPAYMTWVYSSLATRGLN